MCVTAEDNERRAILEGRKSKAKNDIVLRALSEFSDLEALRREKRAIIEEEQRLRALLALEKTTQNKKADRLGTDIYLLNVYIYYYFLLRL